MRMLDIGNRPRSKQRLRGRLSVGRQCQSAAPCGWAPAGGPRQYATSTSAQRGRSGRRERRARRREHGRRRAGPVVDAALETILARCGAASRPRADELRALAGTAGSTTLERMLGDPTGSRVMDLCWPTSDPPARIAQRVTTPRTGCSPPTRQVREVSAGRRRAAAAGGRSAARQPLRPTSRRTAAGPAARRRRADPGR